MKLYNLTLRRPDLTSAVACNLLLSDLTPCLVVSRGTWLEVLRITNENTLQFVSRLNCFRAIRNLTALKSDESDLLVVAFENELMIMTWKDQQLSTIAALPLGDLIGRTSCEYLVSDNNGTVACLGIEATRKIARISGGLSRNFQGKDAHTDALTDASIPNMICYNVCAVNKGADNLAFACLERFRLQDSKYLTLYEFNSGLDHVLKLWSIKVPEDANIIVDFANDSLLLFTDHNLLVVRNGEITETQLIGDANNNTARIIAATKVSNIWTVVQLSDGTLFSIQNDTESENLIIGRIPIIADHQDDGDDDDNNKDASMSIEISPFVQLITLKSGFIFGVAELGNHQLLQITSLDPLSLTVATSIDRVAPVTSTSLFRRELILSSYRQNGSKRYSLSTGIASDTLASTPLPFRPTQVFTSKRYSEDKYDGLIILSTPSNTTTLAIDEEGGVAEVDRSLTGIAADVGTLVFAPLKTGFIQVHCDGLRFVKSPTDIQQWRPSTAQILAAAYTATQLVVATSNKQVIYFELSLETGELLESQNRVVLPEVPTALCFADTQDLKSLRLYIAVSDDTVRLYEVPSFKQLSLISIPYMCSSILDLSQGKDNVLYIGHTNGALSEYRDNELFTRALGSTPVRLDRISDSAILAISSTVWHISGARVSSLIGAEKIVMAQSFVTEDVSGLAAITPTSLEILEVQPDNLDVNEQLHEIAETDSKIILTLRSEKILVTKNSVMLIEGTEKFSSNLPIATATVVKFADISSSPSDLVALALPTQITALKFPTLEHLHDTPIEKPCSALASFKGVLVAAIGDTVIAYSLGKRQLLKQYGIKLSNTNVIRALVCSDDFIFVGDSRNSVTVLRIDEATNNFKIVGTDQIPRSITKMLLLDQYTVCIGDQYGNITILRVPEQPDTDELKLVAHFTIEDAVVSLHKGSLTPVSGGFEAIVYVGVSGTIGMLVPFISSGDIEQFTQLESLVKQYREIPAEPKSEPPRNVINGDICTTFNELAIEAQSEIADMLESSPRSISAQLAMIHYRVAL